MDSAVKVGKDIVNKFDMAITKKVKVLYTGGTIGMKSNDQGVYKPSANIDAELKKLPMFHDKEFAEICKISDKENYLFMPYYKGMRICYSIKEYTPLLDSSNMNMKDWAKIATDIYDQYAIFDGFVVLHGTDTMAYTASALSFMCKNLGKPVVLTGSQIPIFEIRSDGIGNFLNSLIFVGHYCIPEVMVCFDNKILRGNRTIKKDASSFDAFVSPNLPPLATMEIKVTVDRDAKNRSVSVEKFTVSTSTCLNVGLLKIFPGITLKAVQAFMSKPMQGVVLQTYGAGNAPSNRTDLLEAFSEAIKNEVIIVNITQCTRGFVDTSYETGKTLLNVGIIPGGDMTPEAAFTKLCYILGKKNSTLDEKKAMMSRNLRGEMTVVNKKEDD